MDVPAGMRPTIAVRRPAVLAWSQMGHEAVGCCGAWRRLAVSLGPESGAHLQSLGEEQL